jgi:hypothetical protein
MEIRRIVTIVEDVMVEGGRKVETPIRRVASAAVITNPAVGDKSAENLQEFLDMGVELGTILAKEAVALLGGGANVDSFGKACLVGTGGEIEQAAALLHGRYGMSVREVIGGGKAGIPSTKKVAGIGATIDVPLSYRDHSGVATHFDSMEVSVSGSPKNDEIVVILVLTNGGRPHPWIPGLRKEDVQKEL